MSVLADDLAAIFADTSLTVSVEFAVSGRPLQCVRGLLSSEDVPDLDGMGGMTIVSRRVVTVQDNALDGLTEASQGAVITVDDVDYRIHGVRSGGRGKTKVLLA